MDGYVVVLGASVDQLYLIKSIQELGLKTLVIDKKKNSPGFKLADRYLNLDFIKEKILAKRLIKFKKFHKILGVITMGCDVPQIIINLKKKIGLKINMPLISALISKDKVLMKNFLKKNSFKTAPFLVSRDKKKITDFWKKNKIKTGVLKLTRQSGSRGVLHIKDVNEISPSLKKLKSIANDKIIFEEYLKGSQISTESLIINKNKIITPGFVDRDYSLNKFLYPNMIENGAINPSKNISYKKKIDFIIRRLAKKLKITNGVIKGDFVIYRKKPYLIEFATRLSGGDFSESLVPFGQGINYVKEVVRLEVYGKVEEKMLKDKFKKYVSNKYFFLKEGKLQKIINLEKVKHIKGLKKIIIFQKKNSVIKEIDQHKKRSGVFIVTGETRQKLYKNINKIYENLIFQVNGKKIKGILN